MKNINTYFTTVANSIDFDDNIQTDLYSEDLFFLNVMNKHCQTWSIIKIK